MSKEKKKGKKVENCCAPIAQEEWKPSISIDEDTLPAIKGWKIGQKYVLEVEAEMTRISKNEYGPESKRGKLEASFRITNVIESEQASDSEKKAEGAYKASKEEDSEDEE
jgi:hypothetical protein